VTKSGETVAGRDRIRDTQDGMIRTNTRLQHRVVKPLTIDDIAVLYTDFCGHHGDRGHMTRSPWPAQWVRRFRMSRDAHDLIRFVQTQETDYETALSEVRAGRKRSHWMWYIFPQIAGLGSSEMSRRYAIKSRAEAEAYLKHPALGPRLVEICEAVLGVDGRSAHDIFGSPDDMKLRSCAILFAAVSAPASVFERVLQKYFRGEPDGQTLRLLEHESETP
jgi:uncharacterized protein (DUF1810 family)